MKIIVIANNSGGLANFRGKLLKELMKKGDVVAVTPIDIRKDVLDDMGIKVIDIPMDRRGMNPIKDFILLIRIIRIIRKEKPEFTITYTVKPNIYGGIACSLNRVNYAANITGLGTAFEGNSVITHLIIRLYKIGLNKAKVVFFENQYNKNVFVKNKIVPENKCFVLNGAGVDLDKFSYQPYPQNSIFVFLFIGRIMREKGVDELLIAMKRLVEKKNKVELHILGRYEENYEDIFAKYESEGWLKYFGVQEDVRPFINKCDCFVLPSYHEGMANTNLECAASGRPIITSDIPGCMEAVIDNLSGYLCKPADADSLYEKMNKMINMSVDNRLQMGIEGRRHMEELFDKNVIVNMTLKQIEI